MCIKSEGRAIFWNMQPVIKVIRPFCFHQKYCPQGLSPLTLGLYIHVWNKSKLRQKGSFWNWYTMMWIIRALKCCQNLFQVDVCPCPGAFFKWWPWVDLDHFYDMVKFVSLSFCMGDSLYNIECSCITKFVLIQHILSTQESDTGPLWSSVLRSLW